MILFYITMTAASRSVFVLSAGDLLFIHTVQPMVQLCFSTFNHLTWRKWLNYESILDKVSIRSQVLQVCSSADISYTSMAVDSWRKKNALVVWQKYNKKCNVYNGNTFVFKSSYFLFSELVLQSSSVTIFVVSPVGNKIFLSSYTFIHIDLHKIQI